MIDQLRDKHESLDKTIQALNDATDRNNELRDDIEQAEEAIEVYR